MRAEFNILNLVTFVLHLYECLRERLLQRKDCYVYESQKRMKQVAGMQYKALLYSYLFLICIQLWDLHDGSKLHIKVEQDIRVLCV